MSYFQALAAQQTLELRQDLSKLADDAVATSHQLSNVGQADAPDVLESEVEAQQAQLAVTMAEQNRSEEHTSELQSHFNLLCRLLLQNNTHTHPPYHPQPHP